MSPGSTAGPDAEAMPMPHQTVRRPTSPPAPGSLDEAVHPEGRHAEDVPLSIHGPHEHGPVAFSQPAEQVPREPRVPCGNTVQPQVSTRDILRLQASQGREVEELQLREQAAQLVQVGPVEGLRHNLSLTHRCVVRCQERCHSSCQPRVAGRRMPQASCSKLHNAVEARKGPLQLDENAPSTGPTQDQVKHLGKQGDSLTGKLLGAPHAGIKASDRGKCQVGNAAVPVGGPVHGGVVDDDYLPIGREMDVKLHAVRPNLQSSAEGCKGVLR
eukprot:CAMPEP_0175761834 /NCGR_PEP_ID=MMETSP0097-20121207/66874_1 /TAXON_ID=311494 /ORGANISM="Alexandrium monilatum, Strain CCMP3105" /LENGTH=270 /DNA_ID=CAMNT_0017071441 /DNA_START=45 /DNA_END=854 /DNA_ORIENTATION=+